MYRNIENANFQLLHDLAHKIVEEEEMTAHMYHDGTQANSCVGYQNYYEPRNMQVQQMTTDLMHSYEQLPTTTTNSALTSFSNNFNIEVVEQQPSNNFELIAQLAADLVNVTTPSDTNVVNYDANECVYLKDHYKDQQERTLLHSSMSPLLAAVNDITKRDAELQLYLNQSFEKQNDTDGDDAVTPIIVIADKPVPCRAKASLPSRYLRLGEINDLTNEPVVIAKKTIPHPTKFGPVDGVIRYVSTIDLDVLHIQMPRFYPLLLVDESHTLDVSNEDTSNWMRYVRLAENAALQNLHVVLDNGQLYYRTTRNIKANEELHVGYSSAYGSRFLLPVLPQVATEEKQDHNVPPHSRLRPKHKVLPISAAKVKKQPKRTARKHKKLNVAAVLQCQQQQQQHRMKVKSRTVAKMHKEVVQQLKKLLYKCDLCSKRFYDLSQMEKHKMQHAAEPMRKYACHICQQKCATPTALESHVKGHTHSGFTCLYCNQSFLNVRIFAQHVATHKTSGGKFSCMHCQKMYATYALVRKHMRLSHHIERNYACSECNKKFASSSELKRHKGTHGSKKRHACSQCSQKFLRSDQLLVHERQVHSNKKAIGKKRSTSFKEMSDKQAYNCNVTTTPEKQVEQLNNVKELSANKLLDKQVPNIFTASSSNRRKQTPTKLKTLEQKLDTLDYVPLSELLTPYLMSEQELHEEFEKAEIEAALNINKLMETEKQASKPNKLELAKINKNMSLDDDEAKFTCHICPNRKFKRRGIFINHLSKVHPTEDVNNIECLNAPIIKEELVYKCCYCRNIYKSAAKRKLHTLKHHANRDITKDEPRRQRNLNVESVGKKEGEIHKCQLCARQYLARSRLVAHYRKAHADAEIPPRIVANTTDSTHIYEEPLLISEIDMMTAYATTSTSPENKLLKLSSAALELSRYDFLNERSTDDYQRLPSLFDETPLVGIDGLMERYNHRSIEVQFFEKIGKL